MPGFKQYVEETKSDVEKGLEPLRYTTVLYKDGKPLGILSLFDLDDNLIMSYGIVPKHRGNHYSEQIKKEVSEYVFHFVPTIEKITAYIEATNYNSLKSISRLSMQNIAEMYDKETGKKYFVFTVYNPNYIKSDINNTDNQRKI